MDHEPFVALFGGICQALAIGTKYRRTGFRILVVGEPVVLRTWLAIRDYAPLGTPDESPSHRAIRDVLAIWAEDRPPSDVVVFPTGVAIHDQRLRENIAVAD